MNETNTLQDPLPAKPSLREQLADLGQGLQAALQSRTLRRSALALAAVAALYGGTSWLLRQVQTVPRGSVLVRSGIGQPEVIKDGRAWVLPGLHEARLLPARDLMIRRSGSLAVQTVEGLSVGLEVSLRVQLDPQRYAQLAKDLPEHFEKELIEPALTAVLLPQVAQHTVRELFSSKRVEIQQLVLLQLRQRLGADGLILKDLQFGAISLPDDYRRGMDSLLSEGLAAEKMRYTLELKEKEGLQTEIEAKAAGKQREIAAEAAAREQLIAAKAQEEAMKHVLPFKQRQIEQRQLEAEAERQARVKLAEGAAQARQIEAEGEAKARQKLADAEAYRVAELGKVNAIQMEREGQLITKHPLLVQKTLADKLSDKVRVIVAPPGIAGSLMGGPLEAQPQKAKAEDTEASAE
ncbi:SPFH domain-containing protein [Inhella sp.]|uniref:SPFH domain-containing protein n=1 Tax=Inhella sp. TaxID=1921806 RepID=UPI0035AE5C3F